MSPTQIAAVLLASLAIPGFCLAGNRRARRWVSRHPAACRALGAIGLLVAGFAAILLDDPAARAAYVVGGLLAGLAAWTAALRRNGWGDPLCRKLDWDRFDAEFRSHVERSAPRARPRPDSGAPP
jgi:hypothetical protein